MAEAKLEEDATSEPRRVSLFRNGRNQALRIPRDMELPGETATIRKEGDRLVIELAEPVPEKSTRALVEWLKTLEPIDAEFEIPDDPPVEPEDIFGDLADDED